MLLTFLIFKTLGYNENNKDGSDLVMKRGVRVGFRVRVVYQMKEKMKGIKMVVVVCDGDRR